MGFSGAPKTGKRLKAPKTGERLMGFLGVAKDRRALDGLFGAPQTGERLMSVVGARKAGERLIGF